MTLHTLFNLLFCSFLLISNRDWLPLETYTMCIDNRALILSDLIPSILASAHHLSAHGTLIFCFILTLHVLPCHTLFPNRNTHSLMMCFARIETGHNLEFACACLMQLYFIPVRFVSHKCSQYPQLQPGNNLFHDLHATFCISYYTTLWLVNLLRILSPRGSKANFCPVLPNPANRIVPDLSELQYWVRARSERRIF